VSFLGISWARLVAVGRKEFVQTRRDRLTFAMMVMIPIIQLVLFGFAINSDPKHLPATVVSAEESEFSRSIEAALKNSDYFALEPGPVRIEEARRELALGDVQFVLQIPPGFERALVRGERPALLLEADASDPAATSNALGALNQIVDTALQHDLVGPLAYAASGSAPFELRLQRRYNPEGITQYNIVPGLMGVILTMTMIMMTSLGMTRELERGTMENLLATPVKPLEVMIGKILPYVLVGYVQVAVILVAARYVFDVPIVGSVVLLLACTLVFILANLTVGITFSTIARSQTQAIQMGFFFLLPSILMSGFMFPFRGMPQWAQWFAEILPLTHFLRVIRGIVLKGYGLAEVWVHLWPLLLFTVVVMAIGSMRYRRTLD
jgi:ABC-2 type transport system permease protein